MIEMVETKLSRGQELARRGSVRVRYLLPASRVGSDRLVRGAMLRFWLHHKLGGRIPKALGVQCWIDGDGPLDAPDVMPAGGCYSYEFEEDEKGEGDPDGCAVQIATRRE